MKTEFLNKLVLLSSAFCLMFGSVNAQKITFFTPRTVRVQYSPNGEINGESLVVIATPEAVKVKESTKDGAKVYKSSDLIVTVKDGSVAFADAKGNLLTTATEVKFTPITQGPDKGSYRVRQTFTVDADEAIYGVGLLQNGKMSQRGENRKMQQSNLEDYAHVFQSIKGYGIYWDNYSPSALPPYIK